MSPKLIAGFLIFAFYVLIAQAGDNLTEKYEAAKSQITQASISAYSNALSNLMGKAKQKADLDSYLAIQTEQKRIIDGGLVDEGETNSIESVASIAKKIAAERDTRIAVQLRQYISQLEALLKQSMLADKIDEAKIIKEVLDKAKAELAGLESNLPKTEAGKPDGTAAELPTLAGQKLVLVTPNETFNIDTDLKKWIEKKTVPSLSDGILLSPSRSDARGDNFPLETVDEFKPPFVLKATVMTDSHEIRFHWTKRQVFIFNWVNNVLVVDDPASGQRQFLQDKGVEVNKWHNFVWEVNPDGMKISVDGKTAFKCKGDYKNISGSVGIFTYGTAKVTVKAFSVRSGTSRFP